MRVERTQRFDQEAEQLQLRFCCEECAHWAGEDRCRHEWPTELHRRARFEARATPDVVFCKEFELC